MKNKLALFPLIFSISLGLFATYSLLDTLVIKKVEKKVSFGSFDFFSSSAVPSSSKNTSSKSNNSGDSNLSSEFTSSSGNSSSSIDITNPDVDESLFTDTVVQTETLYTDHNLHIEVKEEVVKTHHLKRKEELRDTHVYSAHIYLRDLSHLRTAFAEDAYGEHITEKTSTIARRNNAIFAINGDTYGAQSEGYVLRNGQIFRDRRRPGCEDLAIYRDGSFEIYSEDDYTLKQIADKGAYQVFSFGPGLVKNGERMVEEGDEVAIFSDKGNERVSIGIISPLHYVVAVCDGRTKESYGMQLYEMADYMIGLGAKTAYNLDGGGSSSFFFNDKIYNKPTEDGYAIKERGISDIVYFA